MKIVFEDEISVLDVDLSQLERSDSSGLALLVEWYREAELQNKKIIDNTYLDVKVSI